MKNRYFMWILVFVILIQINIFGSDLSGALGAVNDIYSAGKASADGTKETSYKPLEPEALKVVAKISKNYADKLEGSVKLYKKSDELAKKAYKLFKSIYVNEKEAAKVEKKLLKYSVQSKAYQETMKYAKSVKLLSKVAQHGATALSVTMQIDEFRKSERNWVDSMKLGKNLLVDATSYVPVAGELVGGLDIATDMAVDATNTVIDTKRDVSMQVADALRNIQKSYNNRLRQKVIKATLKKGSLLSNEEIDKIYTRNRINLKNAVEKWKNHVKETNSWFDGDVGVKAYDAVVADADRWMHANERSVDMKRLNASSLKAAELITTLKQLDKTNKQLKNLALDIQKYQVKLTSELTQVKTHFSAQQQKPKPKQALTAYLKKQKAKKLLEENKKLSKEYGELYKKAKLYPNDKNLQNQLAQKDKELRANASAFIALRGEIQKNDPSYKAFIDGPLTIQKRVDKEPQPIAVEQPKEPKVTTEKVKEEPITLAGNKVEELPKAKTATNPNIDTNKNRLDIIKEKDAKLKVAIREKNRLDRTIEKKRERLNQLREQQNNENRYTYTKQQGKKRVKKINISKLKYLVNARHFIQKRSNIPFSKWSKQDKVALGILATNLGVRYGSNIISRAIYLKAMLNRGKFAFLRDKYAATYTYQDINKKRVTPNPNYSMYDLQAKNLLREINALSNKANQLNNQIRVAQSSLMQIQNSLGDTVDDYLNDNKVGLSASSAPTSQLSGEPWAGGTTYNSEDNSDSSMLRYWGGNFFDSDLLRASEGYGPIFNVDETGWKGLVDNGIIKSVRIIHGENSAQDNTKEFIIRANEIDTSSSFYDPHINSLKLRKTLPDGNTLSIKTTGHYDYSAWGSWEQTGGLYTNINSGSGIEQKAMHNNWISGERTKDLPTLGSATYNGSISGHWYGDGSGGTAAGAYGGAVDGSISLTVDFANTSMVGNMQINKVGGGSMTSATLDNINIDRRSASFAARLTGGNVDSRLTGGSQNMISGQFFGPHAEEVGGGWNVKVTNGDFADGIFAAKRQASRPAP